MTDIQKEKRAVAIWLFAVAAMVMIMAIIGAITRLTESGLSIAEWQPIRGALPPTNAADWAQVFDIYKTSPQYLLVNHGMSLPEFKNIFWWEWAHREWGRLIGIVFAAGAIWFWARGAVKRIGNNLGKNLIAILILGLLQGVMGWLMVASGLVHEPAVSHYRLAAHLLLAVALYVSCLWVALEVRGGKLEKMQPPTSNLQSLYKHSIAALGMVIITLIWGAFTAGLRAGVLYNTWPLMNGHWTPDNFWIIQPWWKNYFENHGVVQYVHRTLAYITSLMCISIGLVTWRRKVPQPTARWGYAVAAMGFVQPALGIATVLTQVDLHPAVTHQAGAFVLIGLLVIWITQLRSLRTDRRP